MKPIRVLWLLNHTTLRRFEVAQLRALGIDEIYCPKRYPYDEANLSASVDSSLDADLSISEEELKVLNAQDWYGEPEAAAWDIANRHFTVAVVGFFPRQLAACAAHFHGAIVLRVFGLTKGYSYTQLLADELGAAFIDRLRQLGGRFWFGAGYAHLKEEEGSLLKNRDCFLPVGLEGSSDAGSWRGNDRRIFFICPRIETSPYFKSVYQAFRRDFAGLPCLIGGAQPIRVNDADVSGFVQREEHERRMHELRVMFYHSTEPNHVHYHPFEAIRAGMPLVFMAGGMLDRFGGRDLPGHCTSVGEARHKIARILDNDWRLIDAIRNSQPRLLEDMRPENCSTAWRAGFLRILASASEPAPARKTPRIALIVPTGYRGGSLRGAKLLAQAIDDGARQAGEACEIVFAHLDDAALYPDEEFADLPPTIKRRPYRWRVLPHDEAMRAMAYAGLPDALEESRYQAPDDGIAQFTDCDLWVLVSDRLDYPLLPLRPYLLMVYDYLQRYEHFLSPQLNHQFIRAAHAAERVLVTTEFTRRDALQFAGLPGRKVKKLPMLAPAFAGASFTHEEDERPYFLWTTNLSQHKNHEAAFKALLLYYEEYGGRLDCRVTGVDTHSLLSSKLEHLEPLRTLAAASPLLKRRLHLLGELPDRNYRALLAKAAFLWHPARVDNGTFSVIEAAHLGVPSLSSDYPAMREIDAQFGLRLAWMNQHAPEDMARALKRMETAAQEQRVTLPSSAQLSGQSLPRLAGAYWQAVQECL